MNIGIVMLNRGRGSGEVVKQHIDFLLANGNTVYTFFPDNREDSGKNHIHVNIHLHSPTLPVHEYLPRTTAQKPVYEMSYEEAGKYVKDFEKGIKQFIDKVDIIITHHANIDTVATYNVCKEHKKPFVVFVHGTGIEPALYNKYNSSLWQDIKTSLISANMIITTTEYVKEHLIKPLINIDDSKIALIPPGIDTELFNPSNTDDILNKYRIKKPYVISPGALTYLKGPQNVARALEHYYQYAETIFIGDGDLREEIENTIKGKGRCLGFVPSIDRVHLINAATLLTAAPEKKEHFGMIYLEALSGGTPVVAYKGGGVDTIVSPEVGILTERTPEALGKEIKKLLLNRDKRNRMANKARERALKEFSLNVSGEKLLLLLKNLFKGR